MQYPSEENYGGIDFDRENTYLRARLINIFLTLFTVLSLALILYSLIVFPPNKSVLGEEIIKIFRELHASGVTLVVVTHDMEVALQTDRIVQMKDGRISSDQPSGSQLAEVAR